MDFETYLRNKKIDPVIFKKEEPVRWHEFKAIFDLVHPDSFTAQKLFLINSIRRKYPFHEEQGEKPDAVVKDEKEKTTVERMNPEMPVSSSGTAKPKPRIAPKIKMPLKIKKKE